MVVIVESNVELIYETNHYKRSKSIYKLWRKKTGKISHFYLDNNFGVQFRKKEVKVSSQGYFIYMEGLLASMLS